MPKDPEPTQVHGGNPPPPPPVCHRYTCIACRDVVFDVEYPGFCLCCMSVLWFVEQGPFHQFLVD